ncbi:MAG: hypothetical protein M0O96_00105 [Desulforhopalus sp.]|nr:hypothetical protein [Desulforhopalus sp.]
MKYAVMTIIAVYLLTAYGCKTEEAKQHVQSTEQTAVQQTAVQQTGAEETLPVTDEIQDAVADAVAVEEAVQQAPEAVDVVDVITVDPDKEVASPAAQEAAVVVVESQTASEEIQPQAAPVVPVQDSAPGETPAPKVPAAMADTPAVTAPAPAPETLAEPPAAKVPAAMADIPAVTAPAPTPEALANARADAECSKMVRISPRQVMAMLAAEGEKRITENLKKEHTASEIDTVQTVQSGPACPSESTKPCPSVNATSTSDNKAVEVVVDENKVLKVKDGHSVVQTITKTTTTEKTGDKVSAVKQNVVVKTTPASPEEMNQALIEMHQGTSDLLKLTNQLILENKALRGTINHLQDAEE